MAQNFGINKQSKLFQKFINQKNHKVADQTQQRLNEVQLEPNSFVNNQNQSSLMNRSNRSTTDLTAKANSFNRSVVVSQKNQEKVKNFVVGHPPTNTKIIDNSLNYKNGLGLDEILKRAIEKVRESKIQDLFERKVDSPMADDKWDLKSSQSRKQKENVQNSQMFQHSSSRQDQQRNQIKDVEEIDAYEPHQAQEIDDCKQYNQSKNINLIRKSLLEATAKIKQLEDQITILNQKLESLSLNNLKLKTQINKETTLSEQLLKENKDLVLQVRQLQNMISHKETQIKQKSDDANYWKNQSELEKNRLQNSKNSMKKLEQSMNRLNIENENIRKEKESKENEILSLKIQFVKLNQENTLAKKYLCELTFKLYSYQRQSPVARQHSLITQFQGQGEQVKCAQAANIEHMKQVYSVQMPKQPRKRQFSRQRHQKTLLIEYPENKNQSVEKSSKMMSKIDNKSSSDKKMPQAPTSAKSFTQSDTLRQQRLAVIQQQLQQIRELAFINGKMRRRKIDLQRQLEQINF